MSRPETAGKNLSEGAGRVGRLIPAGFAQVADTLDDYVTCPTCGGVVCHEEGDQ